jgi:hypothetical protein
MERKPQQQTLSIRIPDSLRGFLDRVQQVISNGAPGPVSISEVAKTLLESVKDDRLDFRLEAADLMLAPTDSLAAFAKNGSATSLSRAQNGFCLVTIFRRPLKNCQKIWRYRVQAHSPSC